MRTLFLFVVALSACDLQPPPKKQPPSEPSDPARQAPSIPTPEPALPDAAVAPPIDAFETSPACNDVGVKVAASVVDNAQDPAQKAALSQDRDRIVRRVAEACTRDSWPESARDCFLKAKSPADMQECGKDLAAPRE